MDKKSFNRFELVKGVLCILSYFLVANLLSLIFSVILKELKLQKYVNIAYLFLYLLLALIYIVPFYKDLKKDFVKFKKNYKNDLKIAFKYYLRGIFIMIISNLFISVLLGMGKSTNEMTNISNFKSNPYIQGIIIVLFAPLIEELVFRFSFRKMTKNVAIFSYITGILFGSVHVISSLSNPLGILFLIPYSAMGVALGYAYKKTDSICSSLSFHIIHNTITLLIIIIGIHGGVV